MAGFSTLLPEGWRSPGLSTRELDAAQEAAEAVFPADLCELLTEVLPTGDQFPDWRHKPNEAMQTWRTWLTDGIAFDVIHNDLWLDAWGQRPPNQLQARPAVEDLLRDAPTLIPIYSHRATPNEPSGAGNPVFSITQTDIIIYGRNLDDYLAHEFGPQRERPYPLGRAPHNPLLVGTTRPGWVVRSSPEVHLERAGAILAYTAATA